jgi:hypothetical protein
VGDADRGADAVAVAAEPGSISNGNVASWSAVRSTKSRIASIASREAISPWL